MKKIEYFGASRATRQRHFKTSSTGDENVGALKHVRPFIPTDVAVQIYNVLILPHSDYCSPVWDCMSGYLSDKLQKLQNCTARVITQSPFETCSNLLLAMLKWEKLSLRRKKQKALIMYKTLNELAPDYLQCLFTQRHVNDYNLRNLEGNISKREWSWNTILLLCVFPKIGF